MAKSFAVLGMGRFGKTVAQTLADSGAEVMVVDKTPEIIEQCSSFAAQAIVADLSDEEAVKNLALENMDAVIVAMAMDLEITILCVMVAKEAGVPLVMAKARNHRMGDILAKVGCDKVIYPEEETGIRMAKSLISENFIDYYNLSDNFCLVEMKARPEWIGKNLRELDLRKQINANVIAIKTVGEFDYMIDPNKPLEPGTVLFVVTGKDMLGKIL